MRLDMLITHRIFDVVEDEGRDWRAGRAGEGQFTQSMQAVIDLVLERWTPCWLCGAGPRGLIHFLEC